MTDTRREKIAEILFDVTHNSVATHTIWESADLILSLLEPEPVEGDLISAEAMWLAREAEIEELKTKISNQEDRFWAQVVQDDKDIVEAKKVGRQEVVEFSRTCLDNSPQGEIYPAWELIEKLEAKLKEWER